MHFRSDNNRRNLQDVYEVWSDQTFCWLQKMKEKKEALDQESYEVS